MTDLEQAIKATEKACNKLKSSGATIEEQKSSNDLLEWLEELDVRRKSLDYKPLYWRLHSMVGEQYWFGYVNGNEDSRLGKKPLWPSVCG